MRECEGWEKIYGYPKLNGVPSEDANWSETGSGTFCYTGHEVRVLNFVQLNSNYSKQSKTARGANSENASQSIVGNVILE